ncbi:PREDICTED: pyroglutamyl-peptidase 1-like [Amphimedon queenslandica]|uniref:Pyroglutamyl-peptidase I n=1 Tax=Amphimedon queenslandica TaxID=400682 RepID=A0A1X7V4J4_AMPQE|nr:PREDICTED: pyroglutamyl-peptidase 1-like [Amphimedon queenslandica]|eukprot:XP_003385640.1 PREDICTED: pyroglutamyl-peptidase 1-like [Amphimedon queenslandica]
MSENRTQAQHKEVETKPLTVLVTGFGPFGSHKVNSSWEAVKLLPSMGLTANGRELRVETREIRVSYELVRDRVPALWDEINPDLCIHVGVSPYKSIKYEKCANNHGYFLQDVDSQFLESSTIHPGSPDVLKTSLDLDGLSEEVLSIVAKEEGGKNNVKIEVSFDAGQYLCDFIYYTSLHHTFKKKIDKAPVLFVHVPPLDQPYSQSCLANVLKHTIESILSNKSN